MRMYKMLTSTVLIVALTGGVAAHEKLGDVIRHNTRTMLVEPLPHADPDGSNGGAAERIMAALHRYAKGKAFEPVKQQQGGGATK